jgi:hypothetical protein
MNDESNIIDVWNYGEEKEVSPGNYACLIMERYDWAIWSFDTATGKYFVANKACEGSDSPAPLGHHQGFFSLQPYASIILGRETPYVVFHGKHLESKSKCRQIGDRFFIDVTHQTSVEDLDGKRLEVIIDSMPSEYAYSKSVQQQCHFDMSGLLEVIAIIVELKNAQATVAKD